MNKKTKTKIVGIIDRVYVTVFVFSLVVAMIYCYVAIHDNDLTLLFALILPFVVYFLKKWVTWIVTGKN